MNPANGTGFEIIGGERTVLIFFSILIVQNNSTHVTAKKNYFTRVGNTNTLV